MAFTLGQSDRYGRPEILTKGDMLKTSLFEELTIDLNLVFGSTDEELKTEYQIMNNE
jgi:hypothetical protein